MRAVTPCAVLLPCLLCVAACAPAPAARSEDSASAASSTAATDAATDAAVVRRVIDSVNTQLERWYAASQADSVASVLADDVWLMGPASPPVVGRDSVRAHWRRMMAAGVWRFTLQARDVAVHGPMAVERGQYTLAFMPKPDAPAGAPPAFRDRGNYVVHWVLVDGRWRIKWDIAASELPLTAPPSAPGARAPAG